MGVIGGNEFGEVWSNQREETLWAEKSCHVKIVIFHGWPDMQSLPMSKVLFFQVSISKVLGILPPSKHSTSGGHKGIN
ncbi:unnamed protein product [Allacma fusca]|uniref:Uncharacterized protein n=1 Tax=Allacma fusca TaxID=39272 RepID=A0A8J2PEA3_9HEXA|nr:unnamed protein product [Allacma fusca]